MNTFKKIWLGIIALVVLIPSLLVLSPVAFAASDCGNQSVCLDQQFWDGATYTLQSQNEINVSNGPTRVQFQKAAGNTYDASPLDSLQINGLCGGSSQNTIKLNSPDFSQPTLTGTLSVQYSITSSNQQNQSQVDCTTYSKSLSGSSSITNLTANGSGGTCTYAACSNSDITNSLKSLNLTSDPSQITGTFINGKTVTFTDGAVSDTHHTYSAPIGTFCSGGGGLGSVTIDDGDYQKILSAKENPVPGILDVDWYNATDKSCNNYTPGNTTAVNIDTTAYLASISPGAKCSPPGATQGNLICGGTDNTACTSQGCTWATATVSAGSNNSCESSYTGAAHEFNWISCKILAGLDGLTNTFLGIVQNQLDVCTGTSSTTGNTCSNNILTDKVKQAWRIFRVIATSILVIILLVMVISQAIGSGPFDAYTLRKVLPRLVAIAIFMQISWYVFKFVIDVSNDVGVGIAQLMYFPFGGAGKMSLDNLIGGVGVLAPGFTITALFTGIVVGYIAGGLTIFGVIFLGASAVISLIIGLLVLLFRQILIILLMIFVPIALVAWILPGTQRYWKLWQDNFMKILFMFPLITAMIAGGRIFAFVGATKGVLGLFVVLLGFFGPLWFLPKTFKWGGQAFGALSSAAWQGTQKYRNAPSKYALQKAGVNREQMRASRAERLAEGEGRRWDSLLSGRFNYALGRTSRTRRYRETVEKGRESGDKEALRQIIGSEYERQDHPAKLSTLRNVAQGHLDASTGIDGRNQAAQRWALDQLATFGDWDIISNMRENGQLDERTWQMFVAKNIGKIHQEAPHLSPQRTDLSMIGSQDFASMKPFGFEEWERQFNTGTDRNATTTRVQPSANPEAKRVRMVQQARRALGDDRIMAYVSEPDRARLERVAGADIRGQSVQVTRDARGVIDHVFLPDAGSMTDPATAPAAFASIDQFMQNAEPRASAFARQAVGRELGGGSLSIPEQDALEAHLMDIKGQAATSLQARETYNQVVAAAHDELSARVQRAEQEAVTQGMTPAQISNARTVVEAQVDALRQRFINNGLTPY